MDATEDKGQIGRLVNHSRKLYNLLTKVMEVGGQPRLFLMAAKDIPAGTEVLFDYGDRARDTLKDNPWLGN